MYKMEKLLESSILLWLSVYILKGLCHGIARKNQKGEKSPSAQSGKRVILWDEDTKRGTETIKKRKKKLNYSSNFVNPPRYKNIKW
jgi:hypothetical protein